MNKKNRKLLEKMNKDNRRSSLEKIKRKKRRELIFIVTLFLIVIAVFTLLFSNYLKLKTIDVEGNNQITKEEILEAGNINNNLRTWSIKDEEIQKNIQSRFEIFKSVSVQSKLPSTIKVKVEEYNFIAQNKKEDGSIEIIMENGMPYSGKIRNNYNLPILENFKDDSDKLDEIYRNLNNLKEEVRLQISEIINDDGDNVTIYMKDGQKVKALRASFSDKLNYYLANSYLTEVISNDEVKNKILGLAHIYKMDSQDMAKAIEKSVEITNGASEINLKVLTDYIVQLNVNVRKQEVPTLERMVNKNLTNIEEEKLTEEELFIKEVDNTNFITFLNKQKGIVVSNIDAKNIGELQSKYNFPTGVLNILLEYSINQTGNNSIPHINYIDKIASSWSAQKLLGAKDAIDFVRNNRNYKKAD